MMEKLASDILQFWFGPSSDDAEVVAQKGKLWFMQDAAIDAAIKQAFGDHLARAGAGAYDHWADEAETRLALIILLDQFSRNIFRKSAQAYALSLHAVST